jgi:hypothetical protein
MTDFEPIPAFLRISQEERAAAWKGRKLTQVKTDRKRDYTMPRSIDAAGLALFRQQEHARAEKAKARLAALKQLKAR